ncbi:MAG TPA: alpha/beta hydrolase [Chryseolinea sp.]
MANLKEERKEFESLGHIYPVQTGVSIKHEVIAGVSGYWFTPVHVGGNEVVIFLHGGGYIYGSIESHRAMVSHIARAIERKILLVDYSLAPEHPFPAALNETVAVIQELVRTLPDFQFSIMGDSAGGNLAMSTALKLKSLNVQPALYHVLISPWVNMETVYPSYTKNEKLDPIITKDFVEYAAGLYAAGHDLKDPLISPVHGDFKGIAPTLILVGAHEVLTDDSVFLYQALENAGVASELKMYDGADHVWPLVDIHSEHSVEALDEIIDFITVHQESTVK